jgi:hypothetical protein
VKLLTRESAALMGRKTVEYEGPDGETYGFEIRKLGADEMISTGIIPADSAMDDQDVEKVAKDLASRNLKKAQRAAKTLTDRASRSVERLIQDDLSGKVDNAIVRGVTRPVIWAGPDSECPQDAVPLSNLGPFRARLFADIVKFATAAKEARDAARFPHPNRSGKRGGGAVEASGDAADEAVP